MATKKAAKKVVTPAKKVVAKKVVKTKSTPAPATVEAEPQQPTTEPTSLPVSNEEGEGPKFTQSKWCVVDVTTLPGMKVLAVADMKRAIAIGQICQFQRPNAKIIVPQLGGMGFAKMSVQQLQYLYWNMTQQTPPDEFMAVSQACRDVIDRMPIDHSDESALNGLLATYGPAPVQPAQSSPAAAPSTTSIARQPRQPREPKAPREPGAAPEQPKSGTTTGLVWELAFAAIAAFKLTKGKVASDFNWKPVRDAVMAACEKEGINKTTAGVQYSKFKAAFIAGK